MDYNLGIGIGIKRIKKRAEIMRRSEEITGKLVHKINTEVWTDLVLHLLFNYETISLITMVHLQSCISI